MEIIIENAGMETDEFHMIASGETGDALRKTAKNYLGSQEVTEHQLEELRMAGDEEYEALRRDMTQHALSMVNVPKDTAISLDIAFQGGAKS
ncbi:MULTISPECIES: hypothetical protein [unclassified Chromohalobacter]|uniref:hypothetical protein n=1 Tax=unclassified Chromohalobacter TaxID=2628571 RepID=UPI0024697538|nr:MULTISPECIES: hypothetical protein [unclassified Chromohalobacter]